MAHYPAQIGRLAPAQRYFALYFATEILPDIHRPAESVQLVRAEPGEPVRQIPPAHQPRQHHALLTVGQSGGSIVLLLDILFYELFSVLGAED